MKSDPILFKHAVLLIWFRWRDCSSPLGNEIFYVVSILCHLRRTRTIDSSATQFNQCIGKNCSIEVSFHSSESDAGESLLLPLANRCINDGRMSSRMEYESKTNRRNYLSSESFRLSRTNVTMILFMFVSYRTVLSWMFMLLMLIDQWSVRLIFNQCHLLVKIYSCVILILQWIPNVPMSC